MTAWFHLFKKEVRLGLLACLLPIIAFIFVTGIALYFGGRAGFAWEAASAVSIAAAGFLVFYLIYYLFYSLSYERKKMHLWLHTPFGGHALLLAKLAAGLLSMFGTMVIIGSTMLVSLQRSVTVTEHISLSGGADLAFFASMHLFLLSVSFAVWFLFYWVIFLVFSGKVGTFLGFLSAFAVFLAVTSLYSRFTDTLLYQKLTLWGEIQMSGILKGVSFNFDMKSSEFVTDTGQFSIYAGTYLFEGIIALFLFFAAGWLLNRKVEV